MPQLILVHVGDTFPTYINTCIAQIQSVSNIQIHVLISSQHLDKLKGGVCTFPLEMISKGTKHLQFEKHSKLDSKFRDGFWKYAMLRFFFIYDHMTAHSLTDVFHIEYDNLIYFDFTTCLAAFQTKSMWCVMDAPTRCIPSFLYFKMPNILSSMLDTCLKCALKGENDMMALAKFKNNNPDVGNLPIVTNYCDPIHTMYSMDADVFHCLFDGAAIGQYVGGVDPRNIAGDTTGFINETAVVKCDKMTFEWRNNKPFLNGLPLVNLHIHSKDLNRWHSTF